MSLDINIEFNKEKELWVIVPEGEIDIYTSPKLKDKLVEALNDKEADILIDGKNLDYVDSTGLGALISILKKVRESDKSIYLENIKPNIRKLLNITQLDKIFIIKE